MLATNSGVGGSGCKGQILSILMYSGRLPAVLGTEFSGVCSHTLLITMRRLAGRLSGSEAAKYLVVVPGPGPYSPVGYNSFQLFVTQKCADPANPDNIPP